MPTDFAPPPAETVIDQKAIASGKRRTTVTRYREAQEATR